MRVEGHVAMVTGGGSGIGRASALAMAGQGADIVIADINAEVAGKVATEVEGMGGPRWRWRRIPPARRR